MQPTTSRSTGSRSSSRTISRWSASIDARYQAVPLQGEEVLMSDVAAAEPAAEAPIQAFTVTLIIRRFDPEVDAEPHWQDFDVQLYPTDRVLDALHKIKWEQDGS